MTSVSSPVEKKVKRLKHKWEPVPLTPVSLLSALHGPRYRWLDKCSQCGVHKGTRRDMSTKQGRSGRSTCLIVWRDVYRLPGGEEADKQPPCLQPVEGQEQSC